MIINPEFPVVEPVSAPETIQNIWKLNYQPVGCTQCRQVFLVDSSNLNYICPNCASGKLMTQPALLRNEPPELVTPFQKKRTDLMPILMQFVKGVWLRTDDFTADTLLKRAVPLFWPMWLVDSRLTGHWQGEIGFDYQVKSSQETYHQGNWQTREVVETRIRWEKRVGELDRLYNNVATPALVNHNNRIASTGEYRQKDAVAYAPRLIGKAAIHLPDMHPENSWPFAQTNLNAAAANECVVACNGQHVRNYNMQVKYQNFNWSQLLLPLWLTFYHDDTGKSQMVLINGQTGRIGGRRLASQRKGWQLAGILLGVGLGLFILGLILAGLGTLLPALAIFGMILIIIAFIAGGLAIIPAVWPWRWNRKYKEE